MQDSSHPKMQNGKMLPVQKAMKHVRPREWFYSISNHDSILKTSLVYIP
jgi:hypothetical protein